MKVGSLFAGIGGFDLGLERAGFEIAWQVEIDPYCQRVLAKHWPRVQRYGDIRAIDWTTVPRVDVLCGGFPCQDLSFAGKRAGIDGERSGLWSEYVRAIRALRPRFIIVENVPGLLTNQYMGRVLGDLVSCGYDAEWDCLPASAFGAHHRRDRVWIIAYAESDLRRASRDERPSTLNGGNTFMANPQRPERWTDDPSRDGDGQDGDAQRQEGANRIRGGGEDVADAEKLRLERRRIIPESHRSRRGEVQSLGSGSTGHEWWRVEPELGRVAHGIPHRVDRLRGLGNAVVPQIVQWLGERIMRVERENLHRMQ